MSTPRRGWSAAVGGPRRAAPPPRRAVRVVAAQVDAVCQVRMEGEETDEGAVEVGEVPWGPAAEGPDTSGEGVRDLWGPYAAGEGDEMRLGISPVHTMALPFGVGESKVWSPQIKKMLIFWEKF